MSLGRTILAIFLMASAHAHARIAKIKWEAVAHALRYEIKILQGPETILKAVTANDSPSWRGDLSPGYFTYQIRAVDKGELSGEWTKPQLILVTPKEVQPLNPASGAQVKLTEKDGRLFLKWRPLGKRVRYVVDIKNEEAKYQRTIFEKGEYEIEVPVSGGYQWRVTPLIQAEGSVEKSFLGTYAATSTGETSAWLDFSLELDASYLKAKQRFHPPVLVEIPARQPLPFGRQVEVSWHRVESAEAYEVRYSVASKLAPRGLAFDDQKVTTVIVRRPEFNLPVQDGKRYEVSVRALSHVNKRGLASIVSLEAKTQFEIDGSTAPPKPAGYVFFRSSVAPYSDSRVVTSQSYNGSIDGGGMAVEFGAHHYWAPWLESELSVFQEMQDVDGANDVRGEQKFFTNYVWNVGGVERGLRVRLGMGVGHLGFTVLSPNIPSGSATAIGTSRTQLSSFALIPALAVEQQITASLSLGVELKVPLALQVSGPAGVSDAKAAPASNYRAQATVRWNLGSDFLVELFLGREKRGLTYSFNGVGGEESNLTATRAGLGINYRW